MSAAPATTAQPGLSGPVLTRAVKTGLVGGVVAVYLAATGVIGRFVERSIITGVISLSYVMLIIVALFIGYLAAKNRDPATGQRIRLTPSASLVAGALAGALTGLLEAGFALLFSAVDLREIFISISPQLIDDILLFGQGTAVGSLFLVALGAGIGAVGAALGFMRDRDRRALVTGLTAVVLVAVMEQLIRVMLQNLLLETAWLYELSALSVSGAIIVFVVAAGIRFVAGYRRELMRRFGGGRLAVVGNPGKPDNPGHGDRGRTAVVETPAEAPAPPEPESAEADPWGRAALWLGIASLVLSLGLAVLGFLQVAFDPAFLLVALVVAGVAIALAATRSRGATETGRRRSVPAAGLYAAVMGLGFILPLVVGDFLSLTINTVGIYVLLGLGLNIVVGYAGLLDLGYVAFFAVGGYGIALLTSTFSSLVTQGVGEFGAGSQQEAAAGWTSFWVALPIVVVAAVVVGVLIGAPVLRLRGDYLAIVTLGFGEIVRVLVQSDWLAPILGGSQGIKAIPPPPPAGLELGEPQRLYYMILLFVLAMVYVSWRLQRSRVGRAWAAMREDESVAEGMGISVIKYKLLAFAMGAAVGCLGGLFFGIQTTVTTPESFQFLVSIAALSVIVLGGMGSIPGVIVGAVVLIGLPELLREFQEYRLLFYGAALVAIMILRPEGLVPSARRRRELHEREAEEAQAAKTARAGPAAPLLTAGAEEGRTEA